MESKIVSAVRLKHHPVALIWSDEKPEGTVQFQEGKWGCVMWLIAAAAKGKTAACDRKTFGCFGGGVGLGFGNQYKNFPGGEECFCRFLSSGNEGWERGRQAAQRVKPFLREEAFDNFLHGERYIKTPQQVEKFTARLPMTDIPAPYVIFKPLEQTDPARNNVQVVIFFANPDQVSALVVLANYGRDDNESCFIPFGAGCQTVGIYPYKEAQSAKPRAVVGLTDISARGEIGRQLGHDLMTFAVPLALFKEMESNVEGSFLERHSWKNLCK